MAPPEGGWHLRTFSQVLQAAVADIAENGYESADQIDTWLGILRNAAERELGPDRAIDDQMRAAMETIYRRLVERGAVTKYVPDVPLYTIAMVRPELRAELDRRILAAADLIKIRRKESIEKTLARFQGWSTAIPPGGEGRIDKREVRSDIGKSMKQIRYEKWRVAVDQGHKLSANVADIVAVGSGAIAAEWNDRGEHDKNYDARKEHLKRSGKIFIVRDSWAHQMGLIRATNGFTDEIEMVGQLPFCSCFYRYISSPRRLPESMLTAKGKKWVAQAATERRAA